MLARFVFPYGIAGGDHNCSQRPHRSRAFRIQVGAIARLVLRVPFRPMYRPNNIARQLLSALSVSSTVNKISFEAIARRENTPSQPFAKHFAKNSRERLYVQVVIKVQCITLKILAQHDSRYATGELIMIFEKANVHIYTAHAKRKRINFIFYTTNGNKEQRDEINIEIAYFFVSFMILYDTIYAPVNNERSNDISS